MKRTVNALLVPLGLSLLLGGLRAQHPCRTVINYPNVVGQTWTAQGSPYCVQQTIFVSNLTIGAGVEVRIAPGAKINVLSWLRATGTRTQPIHFKAENGVQGRWGGLVFQGPAQQPSNLTWCVVEEANDRGVQILNHPLVALSECRIRNNRSSGDGGGLLIQLTAGTLTIQDCEITDNEAAYHGGGINANVGSGALLTLKRCTVASNIANPGANQHGNFVGGGIRVEGDLTLENCMLKSNRSLARADGDCVGRGGAIYANSGNLTLRNCLLLDNQSESHNRHPCCYSSTAYGGGIFYTHGAGTLSLTNCLIAGNQSLAYGPGSSSRSSGIYTTATTTDIVNCTIARNNVHGIQIAGGAASMRNSIVDGNGGAQIVGTMTACFSNVQGGVAGCTGNLALNPAFAGPGTRPEHFYLLPGSPCVDAGDGATAFDDQCFPPSLPQHAGGGIRNDMGFTGGPGACDFRPPCMAACSGQSYGIHVGGANTLTLDWVFASTQAPYPGDVVVGNGTPAAPLFLLLGLTDAKTAFGGLTLLVNPVTLVGPLGLGANGTLRLPLILQQPLLVGLPLFAQVVEVPPSGTSASNGLRLSTCF